MGMARRLAVEVQGSRTEDTEEEGVSFRGEALQKARGDTNQDTRVRGLPETGAGCPSPQATSSHCAYGGDTGCTLSPGHS